MDWDGKMREETRCLNSAEGNALGKHKGTKKDRKLFSSWSDRIEKR